MEKIYLEELEKLRLRVDLLIERKLQLCYKKDLTNAEADELQSIDIHLGVIMNQFRKIYDHLNELKTN